MRLILIEPRLKTLGHHYLTYSLSIGKAAKKMGIDTHIIVDRQIKKDARQVLDESGINVIPIFPTSIATITNIRAITWPLISIIYAILLAKVLKKYSSEKVIVCTVSGNIEYLTFAGIALMFIKPQIPPIIQMYEWASREHTSFTPRLIKLYRNITEIIVRKAISRGNIKIAGQGKDVADHIKKHIRVTVPDLPYVIDWDGFMPQIEKNMPLKIGFIGVMRAEKGLAQLSAAIQHIKSSAHFFIQALIPKLLGEPESTSIINEFRKLRYCTIHEGELSIDGYNKIMSELDIIVLPYHPQNFRNKTSNVFAEALGLGKVVVAPVGTSMAKQMREFGIGVAYFPYTAISLAKAIDEAIIDFDALKRISEIASIKWKSSNSAEFFVNKLLEIIEDDKLST